MSQNNKRTLHEGFKDWWQGKDKTVGAQGLGGNYPVTNEPEVSNFKPLEAVEHFYPQADEKNKEMFVDLVLTLDKASKGAADQIIQRMGFYITRLGPRQTSIRHFIQMLQKALLQTNPEAFAEWKGKMTAAAGGSAAGGSADGGSADQSPIPLRSYSKDERYPEDHPDEKLRGKRKQPLVKLLQDEGVPQVMINTIIRNLAKQFKANNITFTENTAQKIEELLLTESFQAKLIGLFEKKTTKQKKAKARKEKKKAGEAERIAKKNAAKEADSAQSYVDMAQNPPVKPDEESEPEKDIWDELRPEDGTEAKQPPTPDKSWKPTRGQSQGAFNSIGGVADWIKETGKLIEDTLGYSYEVASPAVQQALTALRDLLLTEINIGSRGGQRGKGPTARRQLQDWLDWISGPGNPFKLTKSMISGLKSLADSMIEKKLVDSDPITLKNPGNQAEPGKATPTTQGQSLRELAELAFGKAWDALSDVQKSMLSAFNAAVKRRELKDEKEISDWLNQNADEDKMGVEVRAPLNKWGLEQLSGAETPSANSEADSDILDMLADPNSDDLDIEEILGEEPNFKGTDPEQQSPGDPSDQEFIEDVKDSADEAWNDAGMRDFYLKSAEKWITLGGTKAAWVNLSRKEKEIWHKSYAGTGLDPRATYMTPYEQLTDGLKASYTKEEWEREIRSISKQGKSRLRDMIGKVKNRDKSAAAAKQAKEAGIEPESGKIKLSSLNQQLTTISGGELEGVDKLDPTTGERIPGEKGKGASRAQRSAALKVVQKHIAPYLKARGIPIAESVQLKVADLVLSQYQKFKTQKVINEHLKNKFNFQNASEKIIFEELKKILITKGYESSVASKIIQDKYGFAV